MKHIGFLLGGFQSNGGIGRVTSILANALSEREEFEIHTISFCCTSKPLIYSLSSDVHQHALYSTPTSMVKAILCKSAVEMLRKIIREHDLDVLIAAGTLFYPLGILAVRGTNAKCYCWEHTDPATCSDHKFQNWCRLYAVKHADKMVVLTHSAETHYLDKLHIPAHKLHQIYNPVIDTCSKSPYDVHSKRIIAVGRLTYQKNFSRLIYLASRFLPNHPEWSIDIFGKGEEYLLLKKQINEAGLSDRIQLMGQVNNLYERYSSYAFQIMTSRYEGFPMSLLEGAAHRLPLVSFDIPTGPNEIIENNQNGFLVDADDDNQMIMSVTQLMENDDLRKQMSEVSYHMIQKFSLNDILGQWCEIL